MDLDSPEGGGRECFGPGALPGLKLAGKASFVWVAGFCLVIFGTGRFATTLGLFPCFGIFAGKAGLVPGFFGGKGFMSVSSSNPSGKSPTGAKSIVPELAGSNP